jgi:hypothetical protein
MARTLYWVPMAEYENGPAWDYLGRGDTPTDAQTDALDTYEEKHDFRPLPNGDPDHLICSVCGEPFRAETDKHDPESPVFEDEGTVYHLSCEDAVFEEVHCEVTTED